MEVSVLFIWTVDPELQSYIESELLNFVHDKINLIFLHPYSDDKALKIIANVDMIVGWRPSKDLLEKAQKLILFNNPGAGVQNLVPLFKELNNSRSSPITLANCHGNSYFTAQHAVALLLALTNKIIPHHSWMKEGKWRLGDKESKSIPLQNKVIGLLGYGAINQKVHKFLTGFNVSFAICKRNKVENPELNSQFFTIDQLHEFLKVIDVLIIAIPLTKETNGLIKKKELDLFGPESLLINVGRGDIIDQKDLFLALKSHTIAGAGLDVWYDYSPVEEDGKKYPYSKNNPFHRLDNVVLSPHRGASPMDNLERWDDIIFNIKSLSDNKYNFKNVINLEKEY